jgi:phage terminase Nu1 subunit (DNA packaging protein)
VTPEPILMNQLELANLLDVDRNTLAGWTRAGMPVARRGRGGRGHQYDLALCVRWIRQRDRVQHERALAEAKASSAVDTARARKWTADSRRAELAARLAEGEVVPVDGVEQILSRVILNARNAFLGLHSKIGHRHPALARSVILDIDAQVRQILTELGTAADEARPR